jgi:hypothetical protein
MLKYQKLLNKLKLPKISIWTGEGDFFRLFYFVFTLLPYRWIVDFYKYEKMKSLTKGKPKFMNNYLSIGCDALVTLNFHSERETLPFSNRLFNKVTKNVFVLKLFIQIY